MYFGVLGVEEAGDEAVNFARLDLGFDFRTGSGEVPGEDGDASLSSAERDPMSSSSSAPFSTSLASGIKISESESSNTTFRLRAPSVS